MVQARDLAAEVSTLHAEVDQLRSDQLRAEAAATAAQGEYERALAKLQTEFGIETVAEARALMEQLDAQVEQELAKVREQLVAANGAS
jgi:hypothetical protein